MEFFYQCVSPVLIPWRLLISKWFWIWASLITVKNRFVCRLRFYIVSLPQPLLRWTVLYMHTSSSANFCVLYLLVLYPSCLIHWALVLVSWIEWQSVLLVFLRWDSTHTWSVCVRDAAKLVGSSCCLVNNKALFQFLDAAQEVQLVCAVNKILQDVTLYSFFLKKIVFNSKTVGLLSAWIRYKNHTRCKQCHIIIIILCDCSSVSIGSDKAPACNIGSSQLQVSVSVVCMQFYHLIWWETTIIWIVVVMRYCPNGLRNM